MHVYEMSSNNQFSPDRLQLFSLFTLVRFWRHVLQVQAELFVPYFNITEISALLNHLSPACLCRSQPL